MKIVAYTEVDVQLWNKHGSRRRCELARKETHPNGCLALWGVRMYPYSVLCEDCIKVSYGPTLLLYSLDHDTMTRFERTLRAHRKSLHYLSTAGIKDLTVSLLSAVIRYTYCLLSTVIAFFIKLTIWLARW